MFSARRGVTPKSSRDARNAHAQRRGATALGPRPLPCAWPMLRPQIVMSCCMLEPRSMHAFGTRVPRYAVRPRHASTRAADSEHRRSSATPGRTTATAMAPCGDGQNGSSDRRRLSEALAARLSRELSGESRIRKAVLSLRRAVAGGGAGSASCVRSSTAIWISDLGGSRVARHRDDDTTIRRAAGDKPEMRRGFGRFTVRRQARNIACLSLIPAWPPARGFFGFQWRSMA